MVKRIPAIIKISASVMILFIVLGGCGTFVTVKEDPAIPGAKGLKSIGIAKFQPELGGNRFILMKQDSADEYTIVGNIQGWGSVVRIVIKAPEPLTNYAITKEKIGVLASDAWMKVMAGQRDYKVLLVKGMVDAHQFSNKTDEGERADSIGTVKLINQEVGLAETPDAVVRIAESAGVDAVLAGKVNAVMDILRSTGEKTKEDDGDFAMKTTFPRDQFVANLELRYQWVLYDGKTGKALGSSDALKEYVPFKRGAGISAIKVPPGDKSELVRYLNGDDFVMFVLDQCISEAEDYAYALLPHFHGSFK